MDMVINEEIIENAEVRLCGNMFFRIKNSLDSSALAEDIRCSDSLLMDRINEITETLDSNYSGQRSSRDYGGYILFFPTKEGYDSLIEKILRYYNLDFSLSEYEEIIGERAIGNTEWHEQMWLLSSDDALICIHPEEVRKRG